jgi:GNAT superfamily N-acetyltransferase
MRRLARNSGWPWKNKGGVLKRIAVETIRIRAASSADLGPIMALYRELEIGAEGGLDPAGAERIFARMSRYPDYHLYVAEEEGEILGAFALLIMDNLAHSGAPSGVVEDVVVRAGQRGRGIGKRMMEFALERCRETGCYKMALSSNLQREEAHRFYDSLGFERHGYSFRILLRLEE